jgi:4-oxalmesaconate hydratase
MTVIDAHGHLNAPPALYAYKSGLLSSRGQHGKGRINVTEEQMAGQVKNHLENHLDKVGTDIQFLSPRPFQLMHSEKPEKIVRWFCEANNDLIATSVKLAPTRYRGVSGLPQAGSLPPSAAIEELERTVKDLGFVGTMINPDPTEDDGSGHYYGMGDEAWFPLYEKMVELDVPALIHSAACKNIYDTYTNYFITQESLCILDMVRHKVFDTFPNLKIIVAHGGGAIPYHIGRWRASFGNQGVDFDEQLHKFYFDTVLYNTEALECLFKTVPTSRCMFGTENPGTGSYRWPKTGKMLDDTKPLIDGIGFLSDQDKKNIFEDTAKKAFPRFKA